MPVVTCPRDSEVQPQDVYDSRLFQDYLAGADKDWYIISVDVLWALKPKGKDVIMMLAIIEAVDNEGRTRVAATQLRCQTVEILPVLVAEDGSCHTLLVKQSRVPVGRSVVSTPAGMTDGKTVDATIGAELAEEIGLQLQWDEPVILSGPMFVSPGGSNEEVVYCARKAAASLSEIKQFSGHRAGNHAEGEHTTVISAPLTWQLLSELREISGGTVCAKTHHLIMLYLAKQQGLIGAHVR